MPDGQNIPLPTPDPGLPRSAAAYQSQQEGEQQWKENFGSPLEQAYGKAKSWLSEHEDKLDEKYLKPFREGLDNMADDLQNAAETGRTKGGVPLTGPTKALTEAAAAGLRMVPIGKNVKETVGANAVPMDLGGEANAAKKLVEGEGLVYKGEVSPGTGIHMIEHPDHPGITSTFRGEMTPENVHANMERKVKEFGKEYVPPNENKSVYRARAVGEEGVKAGSRPVATDSKEKAAEYAKNLESMTGKSHEVVEIPLKGTTHTKYPLPDSKDTWYSFQKDVPEEKVVATKKETSSPGEQPASHEKLISQVNKKDWYHVPPQEGEKGYAKRGKFYASTYKDAEFYGKPLNDAQRVQIKKPLVGDEVAIAKELGIPPQTPDMSLDEISAHDRKWGLAAKNKGYDSIVLMSPNKYQEYQKTGKIPTSLELNHLEKLKSDAEASAAGKAAKKGSEDLGK